MKLRLAQKRNAAMTLFEVAIIIAVLLVLVAVFLPALHRPISRATRIVCVNNLKQIGLAYRIWAGDNGDIYPMGVSVTNGGSMEMVATGNVIRTFQVMSNELSIPKILICPDDSSRFYAANFGDGLASSNISYFVSVDVTNAMNPQMILSGDRNLQIGGVPVKPGLQQLWTNDPVSWSASIHATVGNIGLADGSVQQITTRMLRLSLQGTGFATNRFAIP
jgi:hypothetical protein